MSGLIPITVSTPPGEEAHIRAEDDASIYQSLFGGDGVSTVGQACKATVLSNNKVRIADGIICVGGHFARIPYGDYIDCEIDSGQSSKNRNDIIVARLETTGTGGIDTYTCEVKKGTAGSTATDPEIVQEDLYKAGKVRELPLYRVKIEGLSITAVEQLFTLRKTNEELEKELASLNSKMPNQILVEFGSLPNASVKSIDANIPDGATNWWIESAWATNPEGTARYPIPYVDVSNWINSIQVVIDANKQIKIATKEDWSGYPAFFIVGYKL